ncbi:hypothetical protein KRX54_00520 [Actinomycetaceae bacterium TAE3-ERU4]|nr:hypothetical protein [Actinomycetaceae bacterium TAE3-ERU4]
MSNENKHNTHPDLTPSQPRIFASTFVSELSVGLHIGGVGALIVLLAGDFGMPTNTFAILGSFVGAGMILNASTCQWWMPRLTAGTIFHAASYMTILGALLLAFAPYYWLAIIGGGLTGLSAALTILLVPITLAGPRAARDMALANGASSTAAILAPLIYGVIGSIPGVDGRLGTLILLLPPIYVLRTIRHIDFVETPSAYAERWAGRRGRKRRKDLSDSFGPVATVQAFGGATHVKDSQRARATAASPTSVQHIPDISQTIEDEEPSEAMAAMREAVNSEAAINHIPKQFQEVEEIIHPEPQHTKSSAPKMMIILSLARIAIASIPEFALSTWGAARLLNLGLSPANAAAIAAAFPLGLAIGRLTAGITIRNPHIFEISVTLAFIGSVMTGLAPNLAVAVTGMALAGMGVALLYPIAVDDLSKLPGLPTRKAAALATIAGGITIFVVPLLLPLIALFVSIGISIVIISPTILLLFLLPRGKAYRNLDV